MNFNVLIVDPIPQTRALLWEAVNAEPHFKKVVSAKNLDEALAMIQSGLLCDVILLSSSFENGPVKQFIGNARNLPSAAEAAFVSVVRPLDQNADQMAHSLVEGVDGLLLAPFSVTGLGTVAEVAKRVQQEHAERRKETAVRIMIANLLKEFDGLARDLLNGGDFSRHLQKFEASAGKVVSSWGSDQGTLHPIIGELFQAATPVKALNYQGASRRVAQRHSKV